MSGIAPTGQNLRIDLARLTGRIEALGEDAFQVALFLHGLGISLRGLGRFEESETALLEALDWHTRTRGAEHAVTRVIRETLAGLYAAWGKPAEAEEYAMPGAQAAAGD